MRLLRFNNWVDEEERSLWQQNTMDAKRISLLSVYKRIPHIVSAVAKIACI